MVAALSPILSDARPKLAERAGLGDRFHYWRGASGRRYLFTVVPAAVLCDFTSAAVVLAQRTREGGLAAREILMVDSLGRLVDGDRYLAGDVPLSVVALVHLLASTEAELRRIVDDLTAVSLRLAA